MKKLSQIIERKPNNPAYITHKVRQALAPFVLFDAGRVIRHQRLTIPWHPHSGVATVTMPYDANLTHHDSMGNQSTIEDQEIQWMASGKGIWHKEEYQATKANTDIGIMQLWILLPPQEEVSQCRYTQIKNQDIVSLANTRVLLGSYQGKQTHHRISHDISYLDIHLKTGETWQFQHATQTRGFLYPRVGALMIEGKILNQECFGVLDENSEVLKVTAITDCKFVLAASAPWPHKIVHQYGQMHSNLLSLEIATHEIQRQAKQLKRQGLL